jgi:hypothetical protein
VVHNTGYLQLFDNCPSPLPSSSTCVNFIYYDFNENDAENGGAVDVRNMNNNEIYSVLNNTYYYYPPQLKCEFSRSSSSSSSHKYYMKNAPFKNDNFLDDIDYIFIDSQYENFYKKPPDPKDEVLEESTSTTSLLSSSSSSSASSTTSSSSTLSSSSSSVMTNSDPSPLSKDDDFFKNCGSFFMPCPKIGNTFFGYMNKRFESTTTKSRLKIIVAPGHYFEDATVFINGFFLK